MAITPDQYDDQQSAIALMTDDAYQAHMQRLFAREDAAAERMDTTGAELVDRIRDAHIDLRDRYSDCS